ncbi:MAG: dihydrolipoamide acetyltransferase family protein, partial [Methyloligellaceae bacterium]
VETQKGAIEIEVFEDGTLDKICVKPGEKVPVGHLLATIRSPAETVVHAWRDHEAAARQIARPKVSSPAPVIQTPQVSVARHEKISPAARKFAAERGVDVSSLAPGADGIVGLREVEAYVSTQSDATLDADDQSQMRKAIASAMSRANSEIPHYYVGSSIDVTSLMSWLMAQNQSRNVEERLLYAAPLVRAVATALKKSARLNGHYRNGVFTPTPDINIGMAIATRKGGLISPAILDAGTLDVDATMQRLNDLVKRARSSGLRSSELSLGTVTITNLGHETADFVMPVIYPPQVAIIGCGQIRERPSVHESAVVPRQLMDVTLAGDHRVSDGRTGAQFLNRLSMLLQKPEEL